MEDCPNHLFTKQCEHRCLFKVSQYLTNEDIRMLYAVTEYSYETGTFRSPMFPSCFRVNITSDKSSNTFIYASRLQQCLELCVKKSEKKRPKSAASPIASATADCSIDSSTHSGVDSWKMKRWDSKISLMSPRKSVMSTIDKVSRALSPIMTRGGDRTSLSKQRPTDEGMNGFGLPSMESQSTMSSPKTPNERRRRRRKPKDRKVATSNPLNPLDLASRICEYLEYSDVYTLRLLNFVHYKEWWKHYTKLCKTSPHLTIDCKPDYLVKDPLNHLSRVARFSERLMCLYTKVIVLFGPNTAKNMKALSLVKSADISQLAFCLHSIEMHNFLYQTKYISSLSYSSNIDGVLHSRPREIDLRHIRSLDSITLCDLHINSLKLPLTTTGVLIIGDTIVSNVAPNEVSTLALSRYNFKADSRMGMYFTDDNVIRLHNQWSHIQELNLGGCFLDKELDMNNMYNLSSLVIDSAMSVRIPPRYNSVLTESLQLVGSVDFLDHLLLKSDNSIQLDHLFKRRADTSGTHKHTKSFMQVDDPGTRRNTVLKHLSSPNSRLTLRSVSKKFSISFTFDCVRKDIIANVSEGHLYRMIA